MRTNIIIATLLFACCDLAIAASDAVNEFASGHRTKYSTEGHPKSKGISMTIHYPKSWRAKEGDRPNVVQNFVSDGGQGFEIAMIQTYYTKLPAGTMMSEKEQLNLFTPSELKRFVPPEMTFISAMSTRIDRVPAGIVEYSARTESAGQVIDSQSIHYIFFYGNIMIQFHCMVAMGQGATTVALTQKMNKFRPLFTAMASSIVLMNQWK